MKNIEIKGKIRFEYENDCHDHLYIDQDAGYGLDLVSVFNDLSNNNPNKEFQVSYWISDEPQTKSEAIKEHLKILYGAVDAKYHQEEYYYSSWTNGTYHYNDLVIGGHDLHGELYRHEGKHIILEIQIKD